MMYQYRFVTFARLLDHMMTPQEAKKKHGVTSSHTQEDLHNNIRNTGYIIVSETLYLRR